jgi:hypothetical protein
MNSRLAKKIKNPLLLLALGICAVISGCSRPPSASDGGQAIEDRIKRDSGGRIRLMQFRKTNGQLAEVMGVKVYTLEYETEIEFLEACKWNIITFAGAIMDDELSFRTTKAPDKPLSELAQLAESATNPGTDVSKGQRFKLVGAIRFEKKEKGWWVDGVKVTAITPLTGSATSSASPPDKASDRPASAASKKVAPTAVAGSVSSPPTTTTSQGTADPVAKFNQQMDDLNTWIGEEKGKVRDELTSFVFSEGMLNKAKNMDTQRLPADFKAAWANSLSSLRETLTAGKAFYAASTENPSVATNRDSEVFQRMKSAAEKMETTLGEFETLAQKYGIHLFEFDKPQQRPKQNPEKASTDCINHLKMIGVALRTWAIDNDGNFPFNVSTNKGGTKELCSPGSDGFDRNAFLHFMVMSNELSTPWILICPADSSKHTADTFQKSFQADNVTYQMRSGANISETTTPREVILRCPIHGHVVQCDGTVIKASAPIGP